MVSSEAGFGFGRDRRVRRHADFVRTQREARRVTTRHFVLLVAARASEDVAGPSRLGLIVTRKIGNAVARNRIKRVCRECFRQWPTLLPAGVDLLVVARTGADALSLADARAEWEGVAELVKKRASEALARARAMPHVSGGRRPR